MFHFLIVLLIVAAPLALVAYHRAHKKAARPSQSGSAPDRPRDLPGGGEIP